MQLKSLINGILLEDNQVFLSWGESLNVIESKLASNKIDKGDRVIYDWGEHAVLNGLKVRLSTTRWKTLNNLLSKRFNELESWTIGDQEAPTEYLRISDHLTKSLGEPTEKDEHQVSQKFLAWRFDSVSVELHLLEQHCYKLVLRIKNEGNRKTVD